MSSLPAVALVRDGQDRPFCRGAELADTISAIRAEDCRAVFLTSDSGLGASTILRKLANEAGGYVPVLAVHGSQSLARIPFGALAPYAGTIDEPSEVFRVGVLRKVLAEFDRRWDGLGVAEPPGKDLPVFVIDDAHFIDAATADLVVNLVMSGVANVVLSHSRRHPLPHPLPKLWNTGMAENIDLLPLSQEQGHDYCEALLGGPVLPATSWHFWSSAGGNPLFLNLLLSEALVQGSLEKHRGIWVGQHKPPVHSRGLEDAVRTVLRGLSQEGRDALNLVALSEPLAETALRGLVAEEAVAELLDWPLIIRQPASDGLLVLANPIYGQVVRELVPVTQSRVLHEKLIDRVHEGAESKEKLLRRVMWAVEVGVEVPDGTMLRAAVLASKMFQSATALELAGRIKDGPFSFKAAMVKARAKYNMGDYRGAFELMESVGGAATVEDLVFGSRLRASTRSALGMPVEALLGDARALRESAEELAQANPAQAQAIRKRAHGSAVLVELMAYSRAGRYSEMTELTKMLSAQQGIPAAVDKLYRTMVLMMDSERLTAQGHPEQGAARAAEAFAIEHAEENDVFFLPESILLRQLTALLCAGDWEGTAVIMERHSLEAGPIVLSFGGGAGVVRGLALLRAGQIEQALESLQNGLDALQFSDPQQLLGFGTGMAAYAAARLGQAALASRYLMEHAECTGMYIVVAHERAFRAAAAHLLKSDGGTPAALLAQADTAKGLGTRMVELNALVLMLELGCEEIAERLASVAQQVEGPWAGAIAGYAAALHNFDAVALAEAGERLGASGIAGLAKLALAKSATLSGGHAAGGLSRQPKAKVPKATAGLGVKAASQLLTRREMEVAQLAVGGMSDREISEKLTLALRTVEGHLYRAYSKLGISARDELAGVL